MDVDLEHALATHHQGAVALAVDELLEVVAVDVVAQQQEARAVAELRVFERIGRDAGDVA